MGHRPGWKVHYAASDHVDWWKSEIKKRGSLAERKAKAPTAVERLGPSKWDAYYPFQER